MAAEPLSFLLFNKDEMILLDPEADCSVLASYVRTALAKPGEDFSEIRCIIGDCKFLIH